MLGVPIKNPDAPKLILVRGVRIVTGHALALGHRIMYGFLRKLLF